MVALRSGVAAYDAETPPATFGSVVVVAGVGLLGVVTAGDEEDAGGGGDQHGDDREARDATPSLPPLAQFRPGGGVRHADQSLPIEP